MSKYMYITQDIYICRERERGTQEITHYLQIISQGFSIK